MNNQIINTPPQVYIVILNWNGWRDTIECIESIFRLNYPSFAIIVCDNASSDGSLERITEWASGHLAIEAKNPTTLRITSTPVRKPVSIFKSEACHTDVPAGSTEASFFLISTGANLGFAGGNNAGVRFALARGDCDYVWLLNNDTVVEPDSLAALVSMAENDSSLGICGSLLRSYNPPHDVQTIGRIYNPWSGRSRQLSKNCFFQNGTIREYIVGGASMLVSVRFLNEVGLMNEDYFLFFEELDWMTRARPAFYSGYAPESVVYHKVGASIGSSLSRSARSTTSDFYQARNRLVFTRKHYPWMILSVMTAVAVSALQRVFIGRPRNALAIMYGAFASFSQTRSKGPSTFKVTV